MELQEICLYCCSELYLNSEVGVLIKLSRINHREFGDPDEDRETKGRIRRDLKTFGGSFQSGKVEKKVN